LLIASLVFYGWWEPRAVPLLVVSITANYLLGEYLSRRGLPLRRLVLVAGLGGNLGGLAYFKYADFGVETWNLLTQSAAALPHPVLPLAISFFTFQQSAYLYDAYRGRMTDRDPLRYALFVTYFPHLIAGPIVHHHELMPQFRRGGPRGIDRHLAIGLTIFSIGLFKKTVLADGLGPFVDPVFAAADRGGTLTTPQAWLGSAAFTLQIYFDFSAYSDMAIGASRMLGIVLPLNFDSPLKATSVAELWRRWHMTLSRLLREYLYFPLGGSRGGLAMTCRNLMVTMLLCGLWHGAGWNFILWGALHGVLLSAEQVHRRWRGGPTESAAPARPAIVFLQRVRTCLWLTLSFVFFRAATFDGALNMCAALVGAQSAGSSAIVAAGGWKASAAAAWVAAGLAIVWCCPNTQQILGRFTPALGYRFRPGRETRRAQALSALQWRPHWASALVSALVFGIALSAMSHTAEFLYFQF
jgi:D-alanyl-lipoteichoic acid acyltransferase DltB (MBOAT superfamily)